MRSVIVICGGWSVSQYDVKDLRSRGYVIGVNESAVLFECNEGITMDRLWAEHRFHPFLTTHRNEELWVRESAAKNLPYHPRIRRFKCDYRSNVMSLEFGTLNGMNSGMVALNRALQHAPQQVYVFGLDMCKGPNGEPYHHPPYEWAKPEGATTTGKYKSWRDKFESICKTFYSRDVRLVQVNDRSMVDSIPSIPFTKFWKETK